MLLRGRVRIAERNILAIHRAGAPRTNRGRPGDSVTPLLVTVGETMEATVPTQQIEAIVADFDLSGFTSFCSQVSRATDIPAFLDDFLEWLFRRLELGNTAQSGVSLEPLWKEPPLFAKFLGDGILLLWDADNMTDQQIARLVSTSLDICNTYCGEFYGRVSEYMKNPPQSLRCRIAKGSVFSVNSGRDYVGHCINIAVHLQEYKMLSFCVASGGLNTIGSLEASLGTQLVSLSLPIRGIKTNEPVWVLRTEFESLKAKSPVAR